MNSPTLGPEQIGRRHGVEIKAWPRSLRPRVRHGSMDVFRCNWDTGRSLLTKPIVVDPLVRSFRGLAVRLLVFIGVCLAAVPALGKDQTAGNGNFFETKIRPVLAGTCSKCHGARKATNG